MSSDGGSDRISEEGILNQRQLSSDRGSDSEDK